MSIWGAITGHAGSIDTAQRAHRIWQALLADYEAPPLGPGVREAPGGLCRAPEGGAEHLVLSLRDPSRTIGPGLIEFSVLPDAV